MEEEDEFVESLAYPDRVPILPQYYTAVTVPQSQVYSPTFGPLAGPSEPRNEAYRTMLMEKVRKFFPLPKVEFQLWFIGRFYSFSPSIFPPSFFPCCFIFLISI